MPDELDPQPVEQAGESRGRSGTRGVVIAAAVAVVVVLGAVLAIVNAMRADDPQPAAVPPTAPGAGPAEPDVPREPGSTSTALAVPSPSTTPPDEPAPAVDGESVCGLRGGGSTDRLSTAPEAEWLYHGTVAYPTSPTYGPGATDDSGFRYCFQHSPEGALFMAANAVAQGDDHSISGPWSTYVVAEGPYREELLEQGGSGGDDSGGADSRLFIAGFRMLHYDGETARVDLAVHSSYGTFSGVYELVWQAGDWKASAETPEPFSVAMIPSTAGYIPWGEG